MEPDVNDVFESIVEFGKYCIIAMLITEVTVVALANLEAIHYYCQTWGIRDGLDMYRMLGTQYVPNGILSQIQSYEETGRTFASSDKYVGETANAIEAKYPSKVVGVNTIIKDSTGRIITDYDIELDNFIIQVKSGTAKGLTTQIQNTAASTSKTVIGYTPDLNSTSAVVKGVQNAGYNIFTTLEELLQFLGE